MAGKPCLDIVGTPLHIVQRANHCSACFITECDYRIYLAYLTDISRTFDCSVHAYVLMSDRIHLLLTPKLAHGVSSLMQALARCYMRYWNGAHGRIGALWCGRYRADVLDEPRYVLGRYFSIECCPVRAGMARSPAGYRWTSHHFNGYGVADQVVVPHGEYLSLGADSHERRSIYRAMFAMAQQRRKGVKPEPVTPTPAGSPPPTSVPD